jgi:ABC-2 type transport system ATP-binding protein/lipopolysaccharide transport system ATP-binding protein
MSAAVPHQSGRVTQFGAVSAILSAQTGFIAHATGIENVIMRGLVLGLSREAIEARVPEIAKFAALGDFLYQPVSTYSSGMTLRLAFAVSTSMRPDILIMDEWIGAGDARFIAAANDRLMSMISDSRILVLASHNEKVVRTFCTRAIVLYAGQIVFEGSVADAIAFYGELNSLHIG